MTSAAATSRRIWMMLLVVLIGIFGPPPGRSASAQSVLNPTQEANEDAAPRGAAKWLVQSTFVASSIETGRIGYVEAWGGDEFGYAYTYALSGAPEGISIDSETGILSLDVPLGAGAYRFEAVVTNRRAVDKVARFPVTLDVRKGVTANRAAGQILSKSYYVDSGRFGKPVGGDFTKVLSKIHDAIIKDQILAGDGNLRATIYFRRGGTYDYTVNSWPVGIQYLTVAPDPNYNPVGPRPRLRNVRERFVFDSELAILGTGGGSAFDQVQNALKLYSPRIDTTETGQDWVQLKSAGDLAKIIRGRWYLIGSYDQQVGGYPPNIRYLDYARVVDIKGTRVFLDRKLRHHHRDDFFEDPSEPSSLGVARIIPLDMGGRGGLLPNIQARFSIRQTFRDIEFLKNPSTENGSNVVLYIDDALDASFENCIMPRPVPTIVEHMRFAGGVIESSEPDKLISTLIFDKVKAGEMGGATGVEYLFIRDSEIAPIQVSPRQLRVVNTTIDATSNTHLWYPVTLAYNGPMLSAEFEATRLIANPDNHDTRVMPAIQRASARIGEDVYWRDGTLVIPRTSPNFLDWQVWLFEGAIVCDDADPDSWGVVERLGGAEDGSAIWASIVWTSGIKPISATISFARGYSIKVDDESALAGQSSWESQGSGFVEEAVPASFDVARPQADPIHPPLSSSFE